MIISQVEAWDLTHRIGIPFNPQQVVKQTDRQDLLNPVEVVKTIVQQTLEIDVKKPIHNVVDIVKTIVQQTLEIDVNKPVHNVVDVLNCQIKARLIGKYLKFGQTSDMKPKSSN